MPLTSDKQQTIEAELRPGETLLWAGQPTPSRLAKMGIVPMLFGIPFTAFALFWTAVAGGIGFLFHSVGSGISRNIPGSDPFATPFLWVSYMPLFGLVFILAGLGLLLSPLWLFLKAQRILYAVTSQRVLLRNGSGWGGHTVRSLSPDLIGDRVRTQQADGSGDLLFPRAATLTAYQEDDDTNGFVGSRTRYRVNPTGFFGIPEVKGVDDLLRQTFR